MDTPNSNGKKWFCNQAIYNICEAAKRRLLFSTKKNYVYSRLIPLPFGCIQIIPIFRFKPQLGRWSHTHTSISFQFEPSAGELSIAYSEFLIPPYFIAIVGISVITITGSPSLKYSMSECWNLFRFVNNIEGNIGISKASLTRLVDVAVVWKTMRKWGGWWG